MKLKKRRKSSRRRGTRLCGWAAKKHKGTGNVGGPGMSGSAKQKRSLVIRYLEKDYFGKPKRLKKRVKLGEINVGDLENHMERLKKRGLTKDGIEINLSKYKILGNGEVRKKFSIIAAKFTNSAKEKIEKAGGKITVKEKKEPEKKKEVKKKIVEKKAEKPEKKAPVKKKVTKKKEK